MLSYSIYQLSILRSPRTLYYYQLSEHSLATSISHIFIFSISHIDPSTFSYTPESFIPSTSCIDWSDAFLHGKLKRKTSHDFKLESRELCGTQSVTIDSRLEPWVC